MRAMMPALDVNETANETDGAGMPKGPGLPITAMLIKIVAADHVRDPSPADAASARPELERRNTRLLAKVPSDKIFVATSVMQKPDTRS